jgi:uncharacterized membrane protein
LRKPEALHVPLKVSMISLQDRYLATFIGTVPINEALLTWRPDAPPENWKTIIKRWERLDMVRAWAAITAFACFLTAVASQPAGIPAGH